MKEILDFLRDLQANNNREWFNENKNRYKKVQAQWNEFCLELIREIGSYDEDIAKLTLSQCTYRIYRDTRFSHDKSPYKTHFGVFLAPGGKKSMHAGYYFHIGTGDAGGYPHAHMLAAGNYCYDSRTVKFLREDISLGWEEFRDDVLGAADPRFEMSEEDALKRVPKGFDADAPYADWMRQKAFCIAFNVGNDFLLQPNLAKRVADIFRTSKPFIDYVNRAVDFEE
ncbi:MAG: DUF2461 domain-containing protein [Bacteroidaceae bacterium]|nr:DUF2461 domain-containing protein [Bacteroidaceae bacterium]